MSRTANPGEPSSHGPVIPRPVGRRIVGFLIPIPQGKGFRGKAGWIARRLVAWYVILLIMLATFQRFLIYQPTRSAAIDPGLIGLPPGRVEAVSIRSADGLALNGWFARAAHAGDIHSVGQSGNGAATAPVVLYFPGNAGNRGYRGSELDLLSQLGADVYLFDYRGYGDNPGRPTEETLAADARAAWRFVTGERGVAPRRVVLLGESLGGGVATRLASELGAEGTPAGGLILRATFSSLTDVAGHHYPWLPVRLLLVDRFPSVERIRSVTCPILTIHGTRDTIVPLCYGQQLFEAAPAESSEGVAKTFVELGGAGHNDILFAGRDEYRDAVRAFFNRIARPSP